MTTMSRTKERAFAIFMVAVSAALLIRAFYYPPQSSQFPRFLMALQLLFSIGLLVQALRNGPVMQVGAGSGGAGLRGLVVPMQVFVATAAYLVGIEQLGYFVSTVLFLCGAMYWFGRHRPVVLIGVTAGFVATVYALFVLFIGIRLPDGLFV